MHLVIQYTLINGMLKYINGQTSVKTYQANAMTCRMTNSKVSAKIFHCRSDNAVNKK